MSIRGNGHDGNGEMSAWLKGLLAKLEEGSRENRAMIRGIKADNRKQDARIAMLEDRAEKHKQDIAEGRRQNREIISILSDLERRNQVELERSKANMDAVEARTIAHEARMSAHEARMSAHEAKSQREHEKFMEAMAALILRITRVEKKR